MRILPRASRIQGRNANSLLPTLREEHRWKLAGNETVRKIVGPKTDEVTGLEKTTS